MADARRQIEDQPGADRRDSQFYARIQVCTGIVTMACASLWFLVRILMGHISAYSLFMFFAGVVVLIIGLVRR